MGSHGPEGERKWVSSLIREMYPWQLLTKAGLQISSLGSSLERHRAPVSLDSLSPGNV